MRHSGQMTEIAVADNPELSRVEAHIEGALAGFAAYRERAGRRIFTHTEVDPAYGGKGVGSAIARAALDQARADGVGVVPLCPFIADWITKHPDYADLVVT
jgi:predicted GNAT family acetyltransferase